MSESKTPIQDSFDTAIAKDQQMSGNKIDDDTIAVLRHWWFMGAGTVARYTFFTNWESAKQYEPYAQAMQNEILDFGGRGIAQKETGNEPHFVGVGEFQDIKTAPMDGTLFEVSLGQVTRMNEQCAWVIYDKADKAFWFCDRDSLPTIAVSDNSGGMHLFDVANGWRELCLNIRNKANAVPEGWESMESAPKTGGGFLAISFIPIQGGKLTPYKCYWDLGLGKWQTKRGKDLPNDTNPVAWQPMKH